MLYPRMGPLHGSVSLLQRPRRVLDGGAGVAARGSQLLLRVRLGAQGGARGRVACKVWLVVPQPADPGLLEGDTKRGKFTGQGLAIDGRGFVAWTPSCIFAASSAPKTRR